MLNSVFPYCSLLFWFYVSQDAKGCLFFALFFSLVYESLVIWQQGRGSLLLSLNLGPPLNPIDSWEELSRLLFVISHCLTLDR